MKTKKIESVIHDWVAALPFTQQAVLMCAMRGPDNSEKSDSAKQMTFYLRGIVMKPAYSNDGIMPYTPGGFMCDDYEAFAGRAKMLIQNHDKYPHHWLMHLIHAYEIVGYKHPNIKTRHDFIWFYLRFCMTLHMNPETKSQLNKRLSK